MVIWGTVITQRFGITNMKFDLVRDLAVQDAIKLTPNLLNRRSSSGAVRLALNQ